MVGNGIRAFGRALLLMASTVTFSGEPAHAQDPASAGSAAEVFVRADVRAFLDSLAANPRPVFTAELLAQLRNSPMANALSELDLPVGEMGAVRNVEMPGPGGGAIALRLYDTREQRAPGPVVVFFHGGGFVVGSIDTHAGLAAELARSLDLPVVSVEYRLAPEHPWPAAPDDAEAAARWIAENGAAFGREFTGLVLSGDSAGGNLALVTALALHRQPAALPVAMQLAFYPATDGSRAYPSEEQFADGFGLEKENMAMYRQHYAADPQSWRHSPLLADLAGLPPTVLTTAALDPLRDEGRAFAAKLIAAGVPTAYYEAAGMVHGFGTYRRVIPSATGDVAKVMALARGMLESIAQR